MAQTSTLVIRGGRLIDGRGGPVVKDSAIVITDGRISAIGEAGEIKKPSGAREIDASGATVMPGLVDAHIHFLGARSMNPVFWALESDYVKVCRCVAEAGRFIDAGFTTVRDMGGFGIYLRKAINEGEIRGPRVVAAGKIINQTGGHGDFHFLPPEWADRSFFSIQCDGADSFRRGARLQIREGADFLKICTTGGVMSEKDGPADPQMTPDEIAPVVEEARRVGTFVASHAQYPEGINNALRAGVKTIEHGFVMDNESFSLFKEKQAIYVPTLIILKRLAEGESMGVPPNSVRKAKINRAYHVDTVKRAMSEGVRIACGSDFLGPALTPHGQNALELQMLVEAGMSPMEAIVAATKVSSEAAGVEGDVGTLETGKYGDVLIVKGKPDSDITVLTRPDNIKYVVKGGAIVKSV